MIFAVCCYDSLIFFNVLSSIPIAPAIVVTLVLSWGICALGYCFTLDTLRRFPGPFIAKLSGLYVAFLALTKSSHLIIAREHQQYATGSYKSRDCIIG
ncbi:hypothetical protein F4680DRAFT_426945 [Xylaria scruposa]|nr:hypothetical protein F4680DRAFT_426945 [Xylaria scruposa]